jgi:hypothetical protein
MKRTLLVFAILFVSASAGAQFMPPARDLPDVARLTGEYQRLIAGAIAETGRYADGLLLIASVHSTLRDGPVNLALENALATIDAFLRRHEKDDPPLPKDVVRQVKLVKTWIEDTRNNPPMPDTLALRERIHHEVLHPMQVMMLIQAKQMQDIEQAFQAMTNMLDVRITAAISAASAASPSQP